MVAPNQHPQHYLEESRYLPKILTNDNHSIYDTLIHWNRLQCARTAMSAKKQCGRSHRNWISIGKRLPGYRDAAGMLFQSLWQLYYQERHTSPRSLETRANTTVGCSGVTGGTNTCEFQPYFNFLQGTSAG